MAIESIFTTELFADFILPWMLVFVLVFAILDKSEILGEGKKQVNAIVGAIIGLILISFAASRDIIVNLIPFLAIGVVVIFIFMLLYGFVSQGKGDMFSKNVKIGAGIAIGIGLIIAVLSVTGTLDSVWDYLSADNMGANLLFIAIAIGAVVAVLMNKSGD